MAQTNFNSLLDDNRNTDMTPVDYGSEYLQNLPKPQPTSDNDSLVLPDSTKSDSLTPLDSAENDSPVFPINNTVLEAQPAVMDPRLDALDKEFYTRTADPDFLDNEDIAFNWLDDWANRRFGVRSPRGKAWNTVRGNREEFQNAKAYADTMTIVLRRGYKGIASQRYKDWIAAKESGDREAMLSVAGISKEIVDYQMAGLVAPTSNRRKKTDEQIDKELKEYGSKVEAENFVAHMEAFGDDFSPHEKEIVFKALEKGEGLPPEYESDFITIFRTNPEKGARLLYLTDIARKNEYAWIKDNLVHPFVSGVKNLTYGIGDEVYDLVEFQSLISNLKEMGDADKSHSLWNEAEWAVFRSLKGRQLVRQTSLSNRGLDNSPFAQTFSSAADVGADNPEATVNRMCAERLAREALPREEQLKRRKEELMLRLATSHKPYDNYNSFSKAISGAIGTLPYMVAMAAPFVGPSVGVLSQFSNVRNDIIMNGGNPDEAVGAQLLLAAGWSAIEKQQFLTFSKPLTGLQKKVILDRIANTAWKNGKLGALGSAIRQGAPEFVAKTFAECVEEGLQGAVEGGTKQWWMPEEKGGGDWTKAISAALNQGSKDFIDSIGTMGLLSLAGSGLNRMQARKNALSVESLVDFSGKRMQAMNIMTGRVKEMVDEKNVPANIQRMHTEVEQIWESHKGNAVAALDEMREKYGLTDDQARTIGDYLDLRSALLNVARTSKTDEEAYGIAAFAGGAYRVGQTTGEGDTAYDVTDLFRMISPNITVEDIEVDDTTKSPVASPAVEKLRQERDAAIKRIEEAKVGSQRKAAERELRRINKKLKAAEAKENAVSYPKMTMRRVTIPVGKNGETRSVVIREDNEAPDIHSAGYAISVSDAVRGSEDAKDGRKVSLAEFKALSKEDKKRIAVTPEQYMAMTNEEREDYVSGWGLGGSGSFSLLDENNREIFNSDAMVKLFRGKLGTPGARIGGNWTLAHEYTHGIVRFLRDMGAIDEGTVALMQKLFGAPVAKDELWNEEAMANGFAEFLRGEFDFRRLTPEERREAMGFFERVWDIIKDFFRRIFGKEIDEPPVVSEKREKAMRTVYEALRNGDLTPVAEIAESDPQLFQEAITELNERRKAADEERSAAVKERKALAKKIYEDRLAKRQKKIERRKKDRMAKARKQWESAGRKAEEEAQFWADIEKEIAAEEAAEKERLRKEADELAKKILAERKAEEARQKKIAKENARKEAQYFINRVTTEKPRLKPSQFLVDENTPEAAERSQRGFKAYEALWKVSLRKPLSDADADFVVNEYGIPAEVLKNLNKLDPKSLERYNDAIARIWADASLVEIDVPPVYVASEEDSKRILPNEVYDHVFKRFVNGKVVVDPEKAEPFTPEVATEPPPQESAPTKRHSVNRPLWDGNPGTLAEAIINGYTIPTEHRKYVNAVLKKAQEAEQSDGDHKWVDGEERWSVVTPAEDAAYLDAVKRGDMETARKVMLEAAEKVGYRVAAYHGTPNGGFYRFGGKPTRNGATPSASIWFAEERDYARNYTENVDWSQGDNPQIYSVLLNVSNFAHLGNCRQEAIEYSDNGKEVASPKLKEVAQAIKCRPDQLLQIAKKYYCDFVWQVTERQEFVDLAQKNGIDGITATENGHLTYGVFNANQIKSADPVTYDDAGNVIPLSQRFNPQKSDIRFSLIVGERTAERLENSQEILENLAIAKKMIGVSQDKIFTLNPNGVAVDFKGEMKLKNRAAWNALSEEEKLKVKVATGWEVGTDGLWRYEMPDINRGLIKEADPKLVEELNAYKTRRREAIKLYNHITDERHIAYAKFNAKYGIWDAPAKLKEDEEFQKLSQLQAMYDELANVAGRKVGSLKRKILKQRIGDLKAKGTLAAILKGTPIEKGFPSIVNYGLEFSAKKADEFANYSPREKKITIFFDKKVDAPSAAIEESLIHEIQHAIQEYEFFTEGGSPSRYLSYAEYKKIAGEVEARNAGRRVYSSTPEMMSLLESTEDVSRSEQTYPYMGRLETFEEFVSNYKKDVDAIAGLNAESDNRFSVASAMPEGYVDTDAEGRTRFSIATYMGGGRKTLVKWLDGAVGRKDITRKDADDIIAETDRICDVAEKLAGTGEFAHFSKWSEAVVETDKDGNPYFGVIRPNGDYAYNIDFSTVCKKRRPLDRIFASLVEDGTITDENINVLLSQENIPRIQDIIKRHGLEVACALCFVDSKRYKIGEVAKNFSTLWNGIVDMQKAGGKKWKEALRKAEAKQTKTFYERAVMLVGSNPSARTKVDAGWLVAGESMDNFAKEHSAIHDLYRSFGGVSKAKDAHADVPYNNDILKVFNHFLNPKNAMRSITPEKAYAVGGVRLQSFSDFVPALFFDYAQMFAELAAKKLPLHTYTKEADFVKIFGGTNAKINMSLVPAGTGIKWLTAEEGKKLGLQAVWGANSKPVAKGGKTAFYEMSDETFPIAEAFALRDKGGNVGTIMVGVSDEHIGLSLADPRIDMVIPYHKSSINPTVAKMRGIDKYADYTLDQSTKRPKGEKDFDFYADLAKTRDPKATARNYVEWCKAKGFQPKMSATKGGNDFSANENYYKILADFRLYADGGKYSPQTAIKAKYPKNLTQVLREALTHDQADADALDRETEPIKAEIRAEVFKMQGYLAPRHSVRVTKKEYALISSEIANQESKAFSQGKEPPSMGYVHTFDYGYQYYRFADTTFSVEKRWKLDGKNGTIYWKLKEEFENGIDQVAESTRSDNETLWSGSGEDGSNYMWASSGGPAESNAGMAGQSVRHDGGIPNGRGVDSADSQQYPRQHSDTRGLKRHHVRALRKTYIGDVVEAYVASQRLAGADVSVEDVNALLKNVGLRHTTPQEVIDAADKLVQTDKAKANALINRNLPELVEYVRRTNMEGELNKALSDAVTMGAKAANPEIGRKIQQVIEQKRIRDLQSAEGFTAAEMMAELPISLADGVFATATLERNPEELARLEEAKKKREEERKKALETEEGAEELADPEAPMRDLTEAEKKAVDDLQDRGRIRAELSRQEDERRRAEKAKRDAEEAAEGGESESEGGGDAADNTPLLPSETVRRIAPVFESADVFSGFLIEWVGDKTLEKHPELPSTGEMWKSPVAIRELKKTAADILRCLAKDTLGSPSINYARNLVDRAINELESDLETKTFNSVRRKIAHIYEMIWDNAHRITKNELMEELEKTVSKLTQKGRFSYTQEELDRKIPAKIERWAKWVLKYARMGEAKLQDEISNLEKLTSANPASDDGKMPTPIELAEAADKLAVAKVYGHLKGKTTGEMRDLIDQIAAKLDGERQAFELRRAKIEEANKTIVDALVNALTQGKANRRKRAKAQGIVDRAMAAMISSIDQQMVDLVRFCTDPELRKKALEAIDELTILINEGGNRYRNTLATAQEEIHDGLKACYGDAAKGIRHLHEELPPEIVEQFFRQSSDQKRTYGHLLQLYASCLQRDYAENIHIHGRDEQIAAMEAALTAQDKMFHTWAVNWYKHNRQALSDAVEEVTGLPVIAPDELYVPVRVETEPSGIPAEVVAWSPVPRALSRRVRHGLDFDENAHFLTMLNEQAETRAQTIGYAMTGIILRDTIASRDVQTAARRNASPSDMNAVILHLRDILAQDVGKERSDAEICLKFLRKWAARFNIAWNPSSALAQPASISVWANVLLDGKAWGATSVLEAMSTAATEEGRAAIAELRASDGYRARYKLGWSEEVANVIANPNEPKLLSKLSAMFDKGMALSQFTDACCSLWIAQGFYRHATDVFVRRGETIEEAKRKALALTWAAVEQTQQSGRVENLSAIQRGRGKNWINAILQFKTAQILQNSYIIRAYRDVRAGVPGAKGRLARAIFIATVWAPGYLSLKGALWALIMGAKPEPDDEEEMPLWFREMLYSAVDGMTAPLFVTSLFVEKPLREMLNLKSYPRRTGFASVDTVKRLVEDAYDLISDPITLEEELTSEKIIDDIWKVFGDTFAPARHLRKAINNRRED